MKISERVTLIGIILSALFSVTAIVLSSVSIYYNFFHVNQQLKVFVSDIDFSERKGTFTTKIFVINSGSVDILIGNIQEIIYAGNNNYKDIATIKSNTVFPVVVESKKCKEILLTTKFDSAFSEYHAADNDETISGVFDIKRYMGNVGYCYLGLSVDTYGDRGRMIGLEYFAKIYNKNGQYYGCNIENKPMVFSDSNEKMKSIKIYKKYLENH